MKRSGLGRSGSLAALALAGLMLAAGGGSLRAAPRPEPVEISLLRIEMQKALLQEKAAPSITALRTQKLQELQAEKKTDEAADAEVDLIQAQTAEGLAKIAVKELDFQLKEAIREANTPQPPAPAPPQPAPGQQAQEPPATPAEITMLQFEQEKADLNAKGAADVAANRQQLFAAKQASGRATHVQLADAQADAIAAQTNAQLLALEAQEAKMRMDAAVSSAAPPGPR